jgi:hypothetical protein
MQVVFERCYFTNPNTGEKGTHLTLLPFAITLFFVYGLAYPAIVGWSLYHNQEKCIGDQLLRAQEKGKTEDTNIFWSTRVRYSKLYYQFKPKYYYWICCILLRKFSIAFTQIMFRGNPTFQLAVALLVMFLSYVAHVEAKPYMSNSEREAVIEEARAEGILPASQKFGAKNKHIRRKKLKLGALKVGQIAEQLEVAVDYIFNYNTVESVLLACAVLINLGGIMFSSGHLDNEYYAEQNEIIAWVMVMVVVFSMMYYGIVVTFELFGGFGLLKWAKRVFSCCFRNDKDLLRGDREDEVEMGTFKETASFKMSSNPIHKSLPSKMDPVQVDPTSTSEYRNLMAENRALHHKIVRLQKEKQQLEGTHEVDVNQRNQRAHKAKSNRRKTKKQYGQVRIDED